MSTRDLTPVAEGRISNRLPSTFRCERSWGERQTCLVCFSRAVSFSMAPLRLDLASFSASPICFSASLEKSFSGLMAASAMVKKLLILCGSQGDVDKAEGKTLGELKDLTTTSYICLSEAHRKCARLAGTRLRQRDSAASPP